MLSLTHHYDEPVAFGGVLYRARVYSGVLDDDRCSVQLTFTGRISTPDLHTELFPVVATDGARVYFTHSKDGTRLVLGQGRMDCLLSGHRRRPVSTDRETTQSSLADLAYWASGLTHTYLHGALERALALQPEAQLARELDRLETIEDSAEQRAETLAAAADLAKADAQLAAAARERTEERLLETVADSAEADAEAHEAAAQLSRRQAEAADRALRSRKPEGTTGKAAARKKK